MSFAVNQAGESYYSNQSVDALYQKYYVTLYSYGYKFCGRQGMVRDAIQELFLSFCENPTLLDTIVDPNNYLTVSLKRKIIKKLQQQKKVVDFSLQNETFIVTPSYEKLLIDLQSKDEQKEHIKASLATLTDAEKKVLILRFYKGLSYEEIAEKTGVVKRTVYNQIHQAIKKLKAKSG